jgi:hypothetical protein
MGHGDGACFGWYGTAASAVCASHGRYTSHGVAVACIGGTGAALGYTLASALVGDDDRENERRGKLVRA